MVLTGNGAIGKQPVGRQFEFGPYHSSTPESKNADRDVLPKNEISSRS